MEKYTIILEYKNDNWIASYPEISPTLIGVGDTKEEAITELEDNFKAGYEDKNKPAPRVKAGNKYKASIDIDLNLYESLRQVGDKTGMSYIDVIENVLERQFGKKYYSLGLKLPAEYNEILEELAEKMSFGNKTDAVKRLLDAFLQKEKV